MPEPRADIPPNADGEPSIDDLLADAATDIDGDFETVSEPVEAPRVDSAPQPTSADTGEDVEQTLDEVAADLDALAAEAASPLVDDDLAQSQLDDEDEPTPSASASNAVTTYEDEEPALDDDASLSDAELEALQITPEDQLAAADDAASETEEVTPSDPLEAAESADEAESTAPEDVADEEPDVLAQDIDNHDDVPEPVPEVDEPASIDDLDVALEQAAADLAAPEGTMDDPLASSPLVDSAGEEGAGSLLDADLQEAEVADASTMSPDDMPMGDFAAADDVIPPEPEPVAAAKPAAPPPATAPAQPQPAAVTPAEAKKPKKASKSADNASDTEPKRSPVTLATSFVYGALMELNAPVRHLSASTRDFIGILALLTAFNAAAVWIVWLLLAGR
ncbi:MAG: hypothetical protein AB7G17_08460 [Phycisphaerales bacterium]